MKQGAEVVREGSNANKCRKLNENDDISNTNNSNTTQDEVAIASDEATQAIKKARRAGQHAANHGYSCPTHDKLKARHGYTSEQAQAYIDAFNESAGDEATQAIRKARSAGRVAASQGCFCPTHDNLKARHGYTSEQAQAYIDAFNESAGDESTQAIRKARSAGRMAANQRSSCPTHDDLKARNGYTSEQAEAYIDAFNESAGDEATQAIRKARRAGQQAANYGYSCPTHDGLKARHGYTSEQAQAYLDAFNESAGDEATQAIRKARYAGQGAANQGCSCPTHDDLKARNGYTSEQAQAYIDAFNESAGDEATQAIRRARSAGQVAANHGYSCPTYDDLKARNGYTLEQAEAYIDAFNESAGDETMQAIRKARCAGQHAANYGYSCPTHDDLKARNGYTSEQAEAYLDAFNKSAGDEATQAVKRARSAGKVAAKKGCSRPTHDNLKARHGYTSEQAQAYIDAFNKNAGDEVKQAIRKARRLGQAAANKGDSCPTLDSLMIDYQYSQVAAEQYLEAYMNASTQEKREQLVVKKKARELAVNDESDTQLEGCSNQLLLQYNMEKKRLATKTANKKLQKIKKAGAALGAKKGDIPCYTDEYLRNNRGYSEEEIQAYKEAFEVSRAKRNARK